MVRQKRSVHKVQMTDIKRNFISISYLRSMILYLFRILRMLFSQIKMPPLILPHRYLIFNTHRNVIVVRYPLSHQTPHPGPSQSLHQSSPSPPYSQAPSSPPHETSPSDKASLP